MASDFEGRVALVTGGSRGMGRAIAIKLAEGGADVAIGYASRREAAADVVKEIEAIGHRAICAAKIRSTRSLLRRASS